MRISASLATAATLVVGLLTASAATAQEQFQRVQSKSDFVALVDGTELSILRPFYLRNAIKLQVSPQGEIAGTALRKPVTGAWSWENGFFCREMTYGDNTIPSNCQLVAIKGNEMRFISDQGQGDKADFRLMR
ncbi:dihydrodipicolinate reductase [Dinoroseobacter sp. S124A]|uniref:dihydrodipicolinate reductase n=1 Tax=Dinoroseobacter sp. S124A TaxID=3415128 RepID=UPI003C7D665D